MNIQSIILRFSFVLIMVIPISCIQSVKSIPTNTPIMPSLSSKSETATSTPVYTETPFWLSPIVPTFSVNEARVYLLELLADNGNCDLPCLWGITLGKSTYAEAQTVYTPLGTLSEITSFIPEGGAVFPNYVDGDLILGINTGFNVDSHSNNQTVTRLGFQARVWKRDENRITEVFDSDLLKKHLDYYMLPNILREYGKPKEVMVSTMARLPSSGVSGGFKVLLLYPDQGILVNYTMQMEISSEDIVGCPSNAHVELELFPSGQAESFFSLLEPSNWNQIIENTYMPLDETTSLSYEEFYSIFSLPTNECLSTPANLWPIPD